MSSVYIVVTPFFPSQTRWDGSYCFDFVRALRKELELRVGVGEWKVLVFMPGAGEDYEFQGVKVYRFPTRELPSNMFPLLFRRYNERSFLHKVREVLGSAFDSCGWPCRGGENVEANVGCVCHAHTANYAIYALAAKRAFGAKALLHHHDPQSFGLGLGRLKHCALYNAWLFRKFRAIFEEIDCHVFISEMVKRSFLAAPDASWTVYESYRRQMRGPRLFHCRPVRIKRSIILHNGVDVEMFVKERLRSEVEVDSGISTADRLRSEVEVDSGISTADRLRSEVEVDSGISTADRLRSEVEVDSGISTADRLRSEVEVDSGILIADRLRSEVDSGTVKHSLNLNLQPQPPFTIGCIGNYIDWKDHLTLLRALAQLKDKIPGLKCKMIGSESGIVECQRFVAEQGLGDVVEFLPLVHHEKLPEIFRSFDLFVLPSYFEGFGCVFTEAYACGVPFITCEGQGIGDLLSDTRWFIKPHDVAGLIERILWYYRERPVQRLEGEIAIKPLVGRFVEELGI